MERMLIQYQKVFRLWCLWKSTDVTLQWCYNYEGSDLNQTKLKLNVILLLPHTLYHTKAGNFKTVNCYNPKGKSRMKNFLSFDIYNQKCWHFLSTYFYWFCIILETIHKINILQFCSWTFPWNKQEVPQPCLLCWPSPQVSRTWASPPTRQILKGLI